MSTQQSDQDGRPATSAEWITTPIEESLLRGALDLERTEHGVKPHRLPARARRQIPDGQLAMAEAQPSGVRLAFRTEATAIELDVLPTRMAYVGAPPRPAGRYDLVVDGRLTAQASTLGGNVVTVDMSTGSTTYDAGSPETLRFTDLAPGAKEVEIWLTFRETVELIALRTDAPIAVSEGRRRLIWLHHGSSISHGSDADSPTSTWPALASARAGVELINLGFGGSALLDPFTARAMRDTAADLISVKIGINLVNLDLFRLRALGPAVHGFLDTLREGHPDTPLLVVSSVLCPIHEETPGPAVPDLSRMSEGRLQFRAAGDASDPTRLTLSRIRDELSRIVAERAVDDPHLHYLDGRELYGEADAVDLPLPDQLHPDAATHRLIGERFADRVFGPSGPWAVPGSAER